MFNALSLKFLELTKVAEEVISRFHANFPVKSLRTIPDGVKNALPGLNFSLIEDNPTTFEQLRSGEPVKDEKGMKLILSCLTEAVSTLIKTVTTHSDYIRFHQIEMLLKAESSAFEELQKRINWLEDECDEVRQREINHFLLIICEFILS